MNEILSAEEIPSGRYWRLLELNKLEIGQALFVPDSEMSHCDDIPHAMRNLAYYRGLRLGCKFRTQRGMYKARRGTFVERLA